jgi:RNA polymerase-binding transcription factor DksA
VTTDALSPEVRQELQQALERERDDLRDRLQDLREESEALVDDESHEGTEGGIGSGMADTVSDLVQRDVYGAVQDTLRPHLEEVEAALGRLASGAYGTCTNCGKPIPVERLRAAPWAEYCITCAGKVSRP